MPQDQEVRKAYRAFVHQMMEKKESMRGEMDRRAIYGSGAFIQEVNRRFKIVARIKEPGRPRIIAEGEGENENK